MNDEPDRNIASPKYLTAQEVADHLGLSVALLSKYRQTGTGPHYYQPEGPGTRVLYKLDEVEAWVESGAQVAS